MPKYSRIGWEGANVYCPGPKRVGGMCFQARWMWAADRKKPLAVMDLDLEFRWEWRQA